MAKTTTGSWSQGYGFDANGNRWVSTMSGLPTLTSDTPQTSTWYNSSNRISQTGWAYDAAGNIITSGTGRSFGYDAENRQIFAIVNGTTTNYVYDGQGRRVQKTVGSAVTTFVYDPFGNLAREYGTPNDTGTKYLHSDALGSTRLETDASGTVTKCYDYLPFGEEIGNGTGGRTSACFGGSQYPMIPDVLSTKFTSKERDAETGLDYFEARYFSSVQGRFTSADEPFVGQNPNDPQSWDLYTYVRNNPLRNVDPTGKCWVASPSGNGQLDWMARPNYGQTCVSGPPTLEGLPDSTGMGPARDRAIGAAKSFLTTWLNAAQSLGTSEETVNDIKSRLGLYPSSENQKFGGSIEEFLTAVGGVFQLHHIATDKSIVSGITAQFERVFGKAGMTLQDSQNLMELEGHMGRHTAEYSRWVLDRLQNSTDGLSGERYKTALVTELGRIRSELQRNPDLIKKR